MVAKKKTSTRSTRTKADLEEELEDLKEQLQGEAESDPTTAILVQEHAQRTREVVKDLSVDKIVTEGATFGLDVQRTISALTGKAVEKAEELKTLQEAIEVEKKELERLYKIDVVSASTSALIAAHEETKKRLEKEQSELRLIWSEEQSTHGKQVQQRNADLQQYRNREQAEYDYKTKQDRTRAQEEFNFSISIAKRDQEERTVQVNKQLDQRIAEISSKESEIQALRDRVTGLDKEIATAAAKEVAIATNSLKNNLEQKFAMERKDLETKLLLSEQKSAGLLDQITRLGKENESFQRQLDAARSEVKDIAKSAVEGASGQLALSKVTELAQSRDQSSARGGKS